MYCIKYEFGGGDFVAETKWLDVLYTLKTKKNQRTEKEFRRSALFVCVGGLEMLKRT